MKDYLMIEASCMMECLETLTDLDRKRRDGA
jgi:hypothetical protein